jgi:hypothetical protein
VFLEVGYQSKPFLTFPTYNVLKNDLIGRSWKRIVKPFIKKNVENSF